MLGKQCPTCGHLSDGWDQLAVQNATNPSMWWLMEGKAKYEALHLIVVERSRAAAAARPPSAPKYVAACE